MLGLMQDRPLLISQLIEHAARNHGDTEIVSRTVEGADPPLHLRAMRAPRAKKVAEALLGLGIEPGDRVGTLAWNSYRHFELYYGISGIGAVCHTINPRLFPEQIVYIVNHAEDQVLFVDLNLLPIVERLLPQLKTVTPRRGHDRPRAHAGDLQDPQPAVLRGADRRQAGHATTGRSSTSAPPRRSATPRARPAIRRACSTRHRSTVLHAYGAARARRAGARRPRSSILPVVPMFHVNAWGLPYAAPMVGAKLVFPGLAARRRQPLRAVREGGVTLTAGVPTVWLGAAATTASRTSSSCSTVKRTLIGGSAVPPAMIERFGSEHGIEVLQGWGMTEMSPLGTVDALQQGRARPARDAERFAITRQAGPAAVRRRDEDRRRCRQRPAARRQVVSATCWCAARGSSTGYFEGRRREPVRCDGRLVPRPATSRRSTPTATCRSPTAPRT